jgi:acetyl esterase/lipase
MKGSVETHIYAVRNGQELELDAFHPNGDAKATVIVLHGGGWRVGSKDWMADVARALAGHGLLALSTQYRLLGEAPWPAQIADVKSAIRWVRRNAGRLGVAPDKIAVEGFSAGGHLALLAAGAARETAFDAEGDDGDASVGAALAFFPPIEFQIGSQTPGITDATRLLGEAANSAAARLASPIHHVSAQFPPTCLLHGTSDRIVPHSTSQRMFDALSAAGLTVDLHLFAGHTHEFCELPSMLPQVQSIAASFLHRHLVDPEFYRNENLTLNKFASSQPH